MSSFPITAHRLRNQRISGQDFSQPAELAAWLGVTQAQDYASGLLSLGLRLPGATAATIEAALADGSIIRTWALRGTLHLVAAADARWLVGLAAPPVIARSAPMIRQRGLDDATFERSQAALRAALAGRGPKGSLTRQEALDAIEAAGIATAGGRGMHILNRAALDRVVCLGPMSGKQQTFVLFDEWAAGAADLPREAALAELARRYFRSHGPATLRDFTWWSGLPGAEARAGLEQAEPDLARLVIDGRPHWTAPGHGDRPLAGEPSPAAHLIPGFDEYMLGYADRGAAIDAADWQRISPVNGIFAPNLLIDGRVAGTWSRTLKRGAVRIAVSPFAALGPAELAALDDAAERYGRFLGLAPQIAVGPPAR